MTYYRCVTCNRPILFREFTDYGKQCKKCGTPVAIPVTTPRPQFVKDKDGYRKVEKGEYLKVGQNSVASGVFRDEPEEEMSLKEVQKLVRKMENETYKAQELLGKIHDKMIMLVSELEK